MRLPGGSTRVNGGLQGRAEVPSTLLYLLWQQAEVTRRARSPGLSSARWLASAGRHLRSSSAAGSRAITLTQRWLVPHFEKMLYDNAQLCLYSPCLGAWR